MWGMDKNAFSVMEREHDEEEYFAKLPECAECGFKIQQDSAVKIGKAWYCDQCLRLLREDIEFN